MSVKRLRRWLRQFGFPVMAAAFVASCGEGPTDGAEQTEDADDVDTLTPGFTESAVYPEDAWRAVPGLTLPESPHPYANNLTRTWTLQAPSCAAAVRVRFERINLRSNDSLTLYKLDGRRVQRITGNRESFTSEPIESQGVKITLRSDRSGQGWGFKVSGLEIVENPPVCPRIAWRACAQDQVSLFSETAICGCPQQPVCQPLGEWGAAFGAGGGFSGGYNGQVVDGDGRIFRERQVTSTSPRTRTLIGHASQERTHNLAQEVHAMNFWNVTLPSGSANMTVAFSSWQHDSSAQASWPTGAQPEAMNNAVTLFNKAVTCGGDPSDAVCERGFKCVEGACVEAPACSCAEIFQPVCGVHDNTYSSPCMASCAGEEIKHTGECGIVGDNCGGTRDLACGQGLSCEYMPDIFESPFAHASGACTTTGNEGPGCICPANFNPVCGEDAHTYSNACAAGCAQAPVRHAGECGITGDRCGGRDGASCQAGLHCELEVIPGTADHQGTCQPDAPVCTCTREYNPQCGENDVTYSNVCEAGCAQAPIKHPGACGVTGDSCGGIRGLQCQDGLRCRYGEATYDPPYPDAMGSCVPAVGYCDLPMECGMTVRLSCPATWYCESHACRYECNAPVETWTTENVRFETAHPYRNGARQGWTATGAEGTTGVRFVFESFELEDGYDFVTIYDEGWNQVARYSGNLGTFTTAEVPGRVARVVFTSDASVVKRGFVGSAVEYKRPQ